MSRDSLVKEGWYVRVKGSGGHLLFSQWRQTALFYILSSIDNSAPSSCVNRSSIMNIPRDWSMAQCHISRLPFHPLENLSKGFEFNQTRQFLLCYLRGLKIGVCNVTMEGIRSIEPCIRKYYILVAATVSSRLLLYLRYFTRHEMNRKNKAWIRIEYSSDISIANFFFLSFIFSRKKFLPLQTSLEREDIDL